MYLDDKQKLDRVEQTQKEVTEYLISNYAGIKKVEWQGWSKSIKNSVSYEMITLVKINDFDEYPYGWTPFCYRINASTKEIKNETEKGMKYCFNLNAQVSKSSKGSSNVKIVYNNKKRK